MCILHKLLAQRSLDGGDQKFNIFIIHLINENSIKTTTATEIKPDWQTSKVSCYY